MIFGIYSPTIVLHSFCFEIVQKGDRQRWVREARRVRGKKKKIQEQIEGKRMMQRQGEKGDAEGFFL